MNVVVDTSVWSLALRRQRSMRSPEVEELAELIREGRAALLGPVRQELLSGVPVPEQYRTLRNYLRAFPDIELESEDYEEAASFFNRCRSKSVQGSNTDFLICAAATRRRFGILTTDADFKHYARLLPIQLHAPRASESTPRSE
jgi:predicted nucleic acid-binding protein